MQPVIAGETWQGSWQQGVPRASHPVVKEVERAEHKVTLQVHPQLGPNLPKQSHQLGTKYWMSQLVGACILN